MAGRFRKQALRKSEYYRTPFGTAYLGDSLKLLPAIPDASVQAIITSPPFALRRKKRYGNPPESEYVEWFLRFADEFKRVLKDDGSLVIEIGGAWLKGSPTRSIYQFELLVALVRRMGFHLAEEFYWVNTANLPTPAQWVTVERTRVKDDVTPIWWLSKTERPKAENKRILKKYSASMQKLLASGSNQGRRPSGHVFGRKFDFNNGGAIPPNMIETSNTTSNDGYLNYCREHEFEIHPARFPRDVPEFFVRFLTEPGDLVLDPFAGSNMTGAVCEDLGRSWAAIELSPKYLDGSVGRFGETQAVSIAN